MNAGDPPELPRDQGDSFADHDAVDPLMPDRSTSPGSADQAVKRGWQTPGQREPGRHALRDGGVPPATEAIPTPSVEPLAKISVGGPGAGADRATDWRRVRLKCVKWFFFEIAFALLPLLVAWKEHVLDDGRVEWVDIVGRGELLLIAVAITAAGVGEILLSGIHGRLRMIKMSLAGIGVLLMVLAANFYGDLAGPGEASGRWVVSLTVPASLAAAVGAMLLNLASLIVAEVP